MKSMITLLLFLISFNNSISITLSAKEKVVANNKLKVDQNGCGPSLKYIPNKLYKVESFFSESFEECCNKHDVCYGTCYVDKKDCEKAFKSCMDNKCENMDVKYFKKIRKAACKLKSDIFHGLVDKYGHSAFDPAQKKYCKNK